jgi:hypothetical protein
MNSIDEIIPTDVLKYIFSFMNYESIESFGNCSKYLNFIFKNTDLFNEIIRLLGQYQSLKNQICHFYDWKDIYFISLNDSILRQNFRLIKYLVKKNKNNIDHKIIIKCFVYCCINIETKMAIFLWKYFSETIKNMFKRKQYDLIIQNTHIFFCSKNYQPPFIKSYVRYQDICDWNNLLYIACSNDELILVKFLLDCGADIYKDNLLCFTIACQNKNKELVLFLLEYSNYLINLGGYALSSITLSFFLDNICRNDEILKILKQKNPVLLLIIDNEYL